MFQSIVYFRARLLESLHCLKTKTNVINNLLERFTLPLDFCKLHHSFNEHLILKRYWKEGETHWLQICFYLHKSKNAKKSSSLLFLIRTKRQLVYISTYRFFETIGRDHNARADPRFALLRKWQSGISFSWHVKQTKKCLRGVFHNWTIDLYTFLENHQLINIYQRTSSAKFPVIFSVKLLLWGMSFKGDCPKF